MKIITRAQAKHFTKAYANVWYYWWDEYEVQFFERFVKSAQTWHHHEKVAETLFVLEGKLQLMWKANGRLHKKIVQTGDMIETDHDAHTLVNISKKPVKLVVFKQVLTGRDKRRIFKADKFVDQAPILS